MAYATVAFTNLENLEGTGFANVSEFEGDEMNLETQISSEPCFSEPCFEDIVGRSPALQQVLQQVMIVAPTDSTVLLHGETGTGKELIARAIHNLSSRRERPYARMNCAAIPSGTAGKRTVRARKGRLHRSVIAEKGQIRVG